VRIFEPRCPVSKPYYQKPNRGRPAFRPQTPAEHGPPLIFGFHSVEAALANPARTVVKAFMTENAENKLAEHITKRGLHVERVSPRDLDKRLGADTVHQGALLEVEDLEEPDFEELARLADGKPLLVLDHVTDPHNVGAILRSAAVFGCAGVVMTRRHSPPLHGALAKSASGALEMVPVARVQNLGRALSDLKKAGFTIVGLDGEAPDLIEEMAWPKTVALVLGAEGKGMRELTGETCDLLVRVAQDGPLNSLNVSNAAAIALHAGVLARRGLIGKR
jgi:23S rRNA (guanosine2251-2'-O)-methyltransferase